MPKEKEVDGLPVDDGGSEAEGGSADGEGASDTCSGGAGHNPNDDAASASIDGDERDRGSYPPVSGKTCGRLPSGLLPSEFPAVPFDMGKRTAEANDANVPLWHYGDIASRGP